MDFSPTPRKIRYGPLLSPSIHDVFNEGDDTSTTPFRQRQYGNRSTSSAGRVVMMRPQPGTESNSSNHSSVVEGDPLTDPDEDQGERSVPLEQNYESLAGDGTAEEYASFSSSSSDASLEGTLDVDDGDPDAMRVKWIRRQGVLKKKTAEMYELRTALRQAAFALERKEKEFERRVYMHDYSPETKKNKYVETTPPVVLHTGTQTATGTEIEELMDTLDEREKDIFELSAALEKRKEELQLQTVELALREEEANIQEQSFYDELEKKVAKIKEANTELLRKEADAQQRDALLQKRESACDQRELMLDAREERLQVALGTVSRLESTAVSLSTVAARLKEREDRLWRATSDSPPTSPSSSNQSTVLSAQSLELELRKMHSYLLKAHDDSVAKD